MYLFQPLNCLDFRRIQENFGSSWFIKTEEVLLAEYGVKTAFTLEQILRLCVRLTDVNNKLIFSRFCRLEVQGQGVGRFGLSRGLCP